MSRQNIYETEYGRYSEPKQVAPPTMCTIDILYGRFMKDPQSNLNVTLTTVEELARRCRIAQRDIYDLVNQNRITIRTPFGISLKATKITEGQIGVTRI